MCKLEDNLAKRLIHADEYRVKMNASKAPKATKVRANKAIYERAKMTSKRYLQKNPLKPGQKRESVKTVDKNTFGDTDKPDDFADRYDVEDIQHNPPQMK